MHIPKLFFYSSRKNLAFFTILSILKANKKKIFVCCKFVEFSLSLAFFYKNNTKVLLAKKKSLKK